jgi:hypothetical protein
MATINYCNYEIKGTLNTTSTITAGGIITAPGGNSGLWNTGYARSIVSFSDSGSSTITLTLARQDGVTYTTSFSNPQGTVTSIVAGSGLSGGGITTVGVIANIDRGSSQAIFKNFTADSGGTATANSNNDTLTLIGGTNVSTVRSGDTITINATDTNTNNYLTGLSWATATGVLSATRQGLSTLTVDLDGRYVTSSGVTSVATGAGLSGGTITSTGTITNTDRGSSQAIFKNVSVSGKSTVVATGNNDTLTLVQAGGMTITTNAATDTITFSSANDNTNNFVTGGNVTSGFVGLTRSGLSTISFAINNSQITNGRGYVTSSGVTSVGLTSQGDAISIIGTPVTSSGNLGITFQGDTTEYVNGEGDLIVFPSIPQGDITAVVAGTGLSGGGTSGSVTLNNTITNNNQLTNGAGYITSGSLPTVNNATITIAAGNKLTGTANFTTNQSTAETITLGLASNNISQFVNNSGYTTNVGDITGVTAGTGMSGGGTSGTVTLNCTVPVISNNTQISNGRGYVTSSGVTSVGGSTTIASSGGTSPTISANTGTVNASSSLLATGAQIQTAINAATTGALRFVSEWSAAGTGGGSPNLQAAGTQNPGDYYIVSVAGSAVPNGTGTTPNEWAIGDWCIRADLATDTWQKLDNTQVGNVTGGGISGRVAFWNGSSNVTSDAGLTFNGGTNALTATGLITASGGNSSQWNSGYANAPTGFGNSGSGTKTLTITQQDGSTLTTSFAIPQGDITAVVAGNKLTGGGTSGSITLGLASNNVSQWVNDSGYITSASLPSVSNATVTITAGSNLSGGGSFTLNGGTTSITLNNSSPDTGTPAILSNGSVPTLNSGISAAEVRSLIGAGTSSSAGVTSVNVSAGSGISASVSNSTTTPVITITNTAPNIVQAIGNGQIDGRTSGNGLSGSMDASANQSGNTTFTVASNATTAASASTIAYRDSSADISARLFRSNYPNQGTIGGAIAFRTNTSDNYIRFCSDGTAIRNFIGAASSSVVSGVTSVNASTNGNSLGTSGTVTSTGTLSLPWQGNSGQYVNGAGNLVGFPGIPQGDITAVLPGTNMTGGGTSGSVTLNCTVPVISNNNQLSNGAGYVTSSGNTTIGTSTNIGVSVGPAVLSVVNLTQGVITSFVTRTLTLANLGYTGATNANNITNNNQLTNGAGYVTSSGGSMSSWIVSSDSGSGTITNGATMKIAGGVNISTSESSGVVTIANSISNNTQIANGRGYITSFTNNYVTGGNVTSGTVTLNRSGLSNVSFAINNVQIANGAGYTTNTGTTTASNSQTFTNKSGNISQWTNNSGYVTSSGVTSIATTSPILGGTITGSGTLSLLKPSSGAWHNGGVMTVGTDGLSEIGRYLDFHSSSSSTADFDVRLDCKSSGLLQLTGTFKTTSDLIANGRLQVATSSTSAFLSVGATSNNVATNVIHASDTAFRFSVKLGSASSNQPIFRQGTYYNNTENSSIAYYRGGSTTGGFLTFQTNNGSERMRIDSGGQVGINTTAPSATLHLKAISSNGVPFKLESHPSTSVSQMLIFSTKDYNSSGSWFNLVCQAGNGIGGSLNTLIIERDGDVKNLQNVYGQISDKRLKENIKDATPKLDDLMKVKIKNFNFIGHELKQIGVVAQELEEVFPGLVKEDVQPEDSLGAGKVFKSVSYSLFVPMLVKAMQEQQVMIEALKGRLEKLEK